MTPAEIQTFATQAPHPAKLPDAKARRRKQARFFSELRILKTASRLTAAQSEFAAQLVHGFQQGDIAFLNSLLADCSFTHEELQAAVAGAQRVFDTCNMTVVIECPETEKVRLSVRHTEFGTVSIAGVDSQFDCVDSAQDVIMRSIASRISDFFVMY